MAVGGPRGATRPARAQAKRTDETMVTTITVATAELVTSATVTSLALVPILALLVLLMQKEVTGSLHGRSATRLNRALSIGLVPLTIIFVTALVARVADVLR